VVAPNRHLRRQQGARYDGAGSEISMNSREFLNAAGTRAAGTIAIKGSPAETVSAGCIGVDGRCTYHLTNLLKMKNIAVKAICDNNPNHLANAQISGHRRGGQRYLCREALCIFTPSTSTSRSLNQPVDPKPATRTGKHWLGPG